jgi:hypothetical protein
MYVCIWTLKLPNSVCVYESIHVGMYVRVYVCMKK